MIGVTARLPVQAGKEAEFEDVFAALAKQVNAKEDGCHLYELFKTPGQPDYIVLERYADRAALEAHGKTDYFLAAQPALGALLSGPPKIEVFKSV